MADILTNNITSQDIDSSRIVSESDKGVTYTDKKSWLFVPNESIQKSIITPDGYFYTAEDPVSIKKLSEADPYLNNLSEIESVYVERAQYKFGLEFIDSYILDPYKDSAIISKPINLGNFSYITLSVNEELENASAEYYILSGNSEIPILPEEISIVEKEKLFFNLLPRFSINQTQADPVVFQENNQIEKKYTDLSFKDFEQYNYYLTYVPAGDTHKVIPSSSTIRVKIVLRKRTADAWCKIKNVIINKYGGTLEWN